MLLNNLFNNLLNISNYRKLAFGAFTLSILFFYPLLAAQAAAGDLDPTFGNGGKVVLPVTHGVTVEGIGKLLIQPDGKLVGGGSVRVGTPPGHTYRIALTRLNPNGTLDHTFANNGTLIPIEFYSTTFGCAFNLQTDGKVLLACRGYSTTFKGVVVYRYNADGTTDTSFGSDGVTLTDLGGSFRANTITVQPDGKIIIGGDASFNGDYSRFVLVRYNPNGSLDASFGQNGVVTAPQNINRQDVLGSVLVLANGKIVATGSNSSSASSFVLMGYNANGTTDSSFGTNGVVLTPAETSYAGGSARLLPDGKILLFGGNGGNGSSYVILRYNPNGTLDNSFGTNGKVTVTLGANQRAGSFELQPDGKIVLGGYVSLPGGGDASFLAVRFNSTGEPDTSFGTNGVVITDFGLPGGSVSYGVTIQPDGKILQTGTNTYDKYSTNPVLARYLDGGAPDFDFDGDGRADVSIFRPNSSAEWYWLNSANGESSGIQFGVSADKIVPADFDGDGKTDLAVFRNGDWYRLNSSNNSFVGAHFGQTGDVPVPADYDGDGKADLAVYRQGNWYILNSSNDSFRADQFGIASDKPVIGDFDGDGKSDLTVYRDGTWYGQRSRDGFFGVQFGVGTDKPVTGDYDGDGKTDVAVYRPTDGVWYLLRSSLGFTATQFGIATDKPVAADYDGDGKTDIAVYRDGDWYLQQSTAGFRGVQYGQASDVPIPNAFVP